VLSAFSPTAAVAQDGSASAVVVISSNRILHDPLVGGMARFIVPLRGQRMSAHLGAQYVSGRSERFDSPCPGFLPTGTCLGEPIRDHARLALAKAGFGIRSVSWRRIAVHATGDVSAGILSVDSRALQSARSASVSKGMLGADLEVSGSYSPWLRVPIALEAGIAAGVLTPRFKGESISGFNPFDSSFRVARLRIGVSWRR